MSTAAYHAKARFPQASILAAAVQDRLAPQCKHIELAGSMRRRSPSVGDIEFVIVPKANLDLFEQEGSSLLDVALTSMKKERLIRQHPQKCDGPKQKRFVLPYTWEEGDLPRLDPDGTQWITLELYIVPEHSFGYMMAIRTGPSNLSRRWVTIVQNGGLLPSTCSCRDGSVYRVRHPQSFDLLPHPELLELPTEREFFELCNVDYVPPEDRFQGVKRR